MRFRERHQDPKATDIEYRRPHQRLRLGRRLHRRLLRLAVVRLDGRLRRRPALPLPDGRARSGRSRCRNTCAPAPTRRSSPSAIGGCFGCIYSVRGAGGYQMFGITPMPIYDPEPADQLPPRLHGASSAPATSSSGSRSTATPMTRRSRTSRPAASRRRIREVDFRPRRLQRGHRRLQREAPGDPPWPLRVKAPGLSTTVQDLGRPGYYHLGIPLSGAHGPLRAALPPTCWSATTRARPGSRSSSSARSSSSPPMRSSPSPARR